MKLLENTLEKLTVWLQNIETQYGVNPIIFAVLLVLCAPFFYYSIYRIIRILASKERTRIFVWTTVFLAATILPYLYVVIFGRNLPWWVYGILVVLVGQSVVSLVGRFRRGKAAS